MLNHRLEKRLMVLEDWVDELDTRIRRLEDAEVKRATKKVSKKAK